MDLFYTTGMSGFELYCGNAEHGLCLNERIFPKR